MKKYNLINNICGWLSFLIAAIVYLMTVEPTASFWDCGEFITSAYKLEVGHPPGAPFFMITGKLFTLFASDPSQVAIMVNRMSALLSALTILFLFWTITHLAKKLIYTDNSKDITMGQLIIIMGCGLVGALTYTFTDTFWFSAVEGEVYAYSSMFTALVFWLILKWENRADQPGSDKWLVLIAYSMGLSIGVHLLNLLCIPAIGLVYYYKKVKNPDLKGTVLALAASFLLIVVLMYGIIPGFTKVGGWFELFFVNTLGFSYNTGALIYIALLIVGIVWALYETMSQKGNLNRARIAFIVSMALSGVVFIGSSIWLWLILIAALIFITFKIKKIGFKQLNTSVLCLLVILIGYSSFALIPIRSIANTPMDQNSPEHVFSLANYLNREQYGDRPLFYGRTYASEENRDREGRLLPPVSEKKNYDKIVKHSPDEKDKYFVSSTLPKYGYSNEMFFPRMYSSENRHLLGYQIWGGITNTNVAPTMFENLRFFFNYQLGYMYFRYFMWNFSGRQNDIQGTGTISNGNGITGISFIDEYVLGLGPQTDLPPDIANNKGHNVYYGIPLILGILGIIFQLMRGKRGEKQFLITFMLFFMTGIAIILYLNQQPFEPRERDYAYAGSFYAYSIWIGLGVAAIWLFLKKFMSSTPAALISSIVLLLVPIQMASQNWDDHDRSDRYVMRDFGENYLRSCEPNAILFTNGDNDTFPLWYAQEVEGFRTDVRVCNLSYLQTDWYVDQMRRQAYDSEPLPITWTEDRYIGEKGHAAYVLSPQHMNKIIASQLQRPEQNWMSNYINYADYYDTTAFKPSLPLDLVMNILKTQDNFAPKNPFVTSGVIVPTGIVIMPLDSSKINWATFDATPSSDFVINIEKNKDVIYLQEIMILEMLNNINKDGWKRPMYFASSIGEFPLNLMGQTMSEGITRRVTPGHINPTRVNTDLAFDNVIKKYKWGGIDNPNVYLDETTLRTCLIFRNVFAELIKALVEKGDKERALIALDKCMEVIPSTTVPMRGESIIFAEDYYELGYPEKGSELIKIIRNRADKTLQWYARMNSNNMITSSSEIREGLNTEIQILDVLQRFDIDKYNEMMPKVMALTDLFLNNRVGFSDRGHPLDYIMTLAMRDYLNEKDPTLRDSKQQVVHKTLELMQKHKPELLKKYYSGQQ